MCSMLPDTSEGGDPALFIRELSDGDPLTRTAAATEIFRQGSELIRVATSKWLLDSKLANCFVLDGHGIPRTTVGLAVNRSSFDRIRAANGSPRLAHVPDDQDAEEFELEFADGVRLDVLTTRRPASGGAIDRFLEKFGEGIQQVELQVSEIDRVTEIIRERFGYVPIYPQTRAGADGTRVNFFLVPGSGGRKLLIELVESN
jgi:hypothetical protein